MHLPGSFRFPSWKISKKVKSRGEKRVKPSRARVFLCNCKSRDPTPLSSSRLPKPHPSWPVLPHATKWDASFFDCGLSGLPKSLCADSHRFSLRRGSKSRDGHLEACIFFVDFFKRRGRILWRGPSLGASGFDLSLLASLRLAERRASKGQLPRPATAKEKKNAVTGLTLLQVDGCSRLQGCHPWLHAMH